MAPEPPKTVRTPSVQPPRGLRHLAETLKLTLFNGGPGQCVFPINNACNAACDFCHFNRNQLARDQWRFVPLQGAKDAIDILYRNEVHYIVLTGGEPMMHPDLLEIAGHAKRAGMTVLLVTNGSLLTPQSCRALKENGVSSIFISIDAHEASVHEKNRGLPKVLERIRKANALFKELGVQSTASVTMSRLITDYEALPAFLEGLGFRSVTFSYPLVRLGSSFLGYADSNLVNFQSEELVRAFDSVQRLKKRFHVVNPATSLEEMRRFLRGEQQDFECLGGYKYFYLDWELQLWRCHHWETPMCSIYDFDDSKRIRDGCQRCMIDCMRDPSVMQHIAISMSDAAGHVRAGRLGAAARTLLTKKNALSLKSAIEQWRWIVGL
ncbi:MAG: radical SAM protein [Elusimicrobia bacterium]|nr:radical SAM protein [Elusimicrobiota bacterium]